MIEFEKVQTIRKRAKTMLFSCQGCERETDAVSLAEAVELFETEQEDLFHFIRTNKCHFQVASDGNIYLCVTSLIGKMTQQVQIRRLTAKDESDKGNLNSRI